MITYYYIAFRQAESKGSVIAYGSSKNAASGVSPIGSEEIYDDFSEFSLRLAQLGFDAGAEENYALQIQDGEQPILKDMKKSILYNATIPPKVFYGLHMVEGVAEYRELGQDPERIFIGEQAIKNMDPSFAGRPVYVQHVESVNLEKLQEEADGYVMESFYNELDGKHWCKFIVVSDKAHQAIASGWKLSNAYIPKEQSGGGLWHGVEYAKEVMRGEYEHLAIVNNPRYQESIILSPEEFKDYNERKQEELKRLTNEQGDSPMMNFFKRSKVENSSDLENTVVVLPKSGKEFSISDLVTNADISEMQKKEPQMCNGDHMVKVGEDTMSVNDLVSKHMALKDSKKNEDDENLKEEADKQKKNDEDDGDADDKKENEDGAEEMKKEGEDQKKINEEKEEEKAKKNARFETFKNAHKNAPAEARTVEISMDRTARGKSRYGS